MYNYVDKLTLHHLQDVVWWIGNTRLLTNQNTVLHVYKEECTVSACMHAYTVFAPSIACV